MDFQAPPGFLLGVNYPWVNYGQDFGRSPWGHSGVSSPATRQTVAADFQNIRATGVKLVRWFLLCDGRSGLLLSNGIPIGPDDKFFDDVSAALDLAQQSGLQICFPLMDFLWLKNLEPPAPSDLPYTPPAANVLHFAAGREALLENVFLPLFEKFQKHPALFAWEVCNEPEWAIREFSPGPEAGISLQDFRSFAEDVAAAVRETAQVPATLGSARLVWVRAWSEIGLDFLQAHYYPQAEADQNLSLSEQLASLRNLNAPLWLGELPANDPAHPGYSLEQSLDICRSANLMGAGVWRWRNPEPGGQDVAFGKADPQFLASWLNPSTEFCA